MKKIIAWLLVYLILTLHLFVFGSSVKDEILSKELTIYHYSLERKAICQVDIKREFFLKDKAEVIKKLFSTITHLNLRNIIEPISSDFRILHVYLLKDILFIDLSKEFVSIQGQPVEDYFMSSYIFTVKSNFPKIEKIKFLLDGYDFSTLNSTYPYQNYLSLKEVTPATFSPCS